MMKIFGLALPLFFASTLIGTAQTPTSAAQQQAAPPAAAATPARRQTRAEVEQAVLQLEKDWVEALLKADTDRLQTLYANTLVYTHSSGSVDDKAKYIANLKAGGTKYLSINREDIKANVYGNSAVVTCKATIKLKANGEDRTVIARMIHVYAKIKGEWQMVAHQTTKLT